jgi:hypothetical protein
MRSGKLWIALLLAAFVVGCGADPNDEAITVTNRPPATENIKAVLTDLAATGQMNSGVANLSAEIGALRETDPAKADALQKGYDELTTLQNPAQIQAKAKEMLSKL